MRSDKITFADDVYIVAEDDDGKTIYLHLEIAKLMGLPVVDGDPESIVHINGNRLDNRDNNLCPRSELN